MEDLLIAILQFIAEFLMEVIMYFPFDGWGDGLKPGGLAEKCIFSLLLGSGLGAMSLLVLRHTWISHSILRTANLILAPVTAAFTSRGIASVRRRGNPLVEPRHHFWTAFWFVFGLVLVRFLYARRV